MQTRSFTIESSRARIKLSNDGEVKVLQFPLRYSIRPKVLKLLAPNPSSP